MSEELLIWHCAPTLAGMKTGSLFSCSEQEKVRVVLYICDVNRRLVPEGLRMLRLRYAQSRVLL